MCDVDVCTHTKAQGPTAGFCNQHPEHAGRLLISTRRARCEMFGPRKSFNDAASGSTGMLK